MRNRENTGKALCFVEPLFAQKHSAFFSEKCAGRQGDFFVFSSADGAGRHDTVGFNADFYLFDTVTSTLDKAHELSLQKEMNAFTTIICKNQTNGRGQLRRKWESLRNNLYTALVLPETYPFNTEAAAPAFGGLAAYALEKLGFDIALKWPNDLVQKSENGYEKIGGILLEQRNDCLVAGMGINLCSAPCDESLREDFFISAGKLKHFQNESNQKRFFAYADNSLLKSSGEKCADLLQYGEIKDENDNFTAILGFCFALVKQIKLCYEERVSSCNPGTWNALYKKYLAFSGETVLIKDALGKDAFCFGDIAGKIIGLGQEGELLLSSGHGLIRIVGGSITKFKG